MSLPDRITYKILRSKRKTICLEVQAGSKVVVRAPLYASKAKINEFVQSHSAWLQRHLNNPQLSVPSYTKAQEEYLREKAQRLLPGLITRFSQKMGVSPNKLSITSARKRFGSCNSKGNICFSWRLMAYPLEAIEYVVVHELAHLKHLNHSPAFYQFLQQHLSDCQYRASLLQKLPENTLSEESYVSNYHQNQYQ